MHDTIIIIGAGMSGIAAARTLCDANVPVLVLEARDRIGGRTHTDHSLGTAVDLGGSWIHGPVGNPLTPLAQRFGVGASPTHWQTDRGTHLQVFDADGTQLEPLEFVNGREYFDGLTSAWGASELLPDPPAAARSVLDLYNAGIPGMETLSPTQRHGFDYASLHTTQYADGADPHEVDRFLSEEYIRLPGHDLYLHGGGYNGITDKLAEGVPLETGVTVEQVEHGDWGVRVHTNRGVYDGARVIVTVPLSVLQAGAIQFTPRLPGEKQAALGRMGMGLYEKLVFKFPTCFWPTEPERFVYLSDQEPPLFVSWFNHAHYTGLPILLTYHGGSTARHANTLSDEELIEQGLAVLQTMFKCEIPAPVEYLRTGWDADPFSRGSYSFQKVGSQPGDRRTLARPVGERLFFAGEATHPHYFSTVHGAYETGVRAAREIIACGGEANDAV